MPVKVEPTPMLTGLSPVGGKTIEARFDAACMSSDGGLLALRVVLPHVILLLAASLRMLPVAPIVTVFLGSVGCRFSVPAMVRRAAARSLGQPWPQTTAGGGAQRG